MDPSPNPFLAASSMLLALRTAKPSPTRRSDIRVDHGALEPVLDDVGAKGAAALPGHRQRLVTYIQALERVDPDSLEPAEALAFWLNLYNAGALIATAEAVGSGQDSILRVPRVFDRRFTRVLGERLTLSDVEHGKVRRFGDPRIHAALVCGSASCPTLRFEPFRGPVLDEQLDDQMRRFVSLGGVDVDREAGTVQLSRIFLWYGGDFIRPDTMPAYAPAPKGVLANTVATWLPASERDYIRATKPKVRFAEYDWSLACTVA